ncbi:hypothetical protein EFW17_16840 [Halostreptopolyspora alba]|uniref:Uncharacterized protein n=1 Tax=Halostreptopolyspora alba TaxID=2487137 RepID=A0A3N0E5W9_9ACTN|nr:hypothetical protein EFW17_16840 [Nocardiopsaceae bacterium YIM 96095]
MILIEGRAFSLLACQARRVHHAPEVSTELAQAATRVAGLVACGALPVGVAQRTLVAVARGRGMPAHQARAIVGSRIPCAHN